jgi:hypothetical protein
VEEVEELQVVFLLLLQEEELVQVVLERIKLVLIFILLHL